MLTLDLFAVANLLVDIRSQEVVDICFKMINCSIIGGRVNILGKINNSISLPCLTFDAEAEKERRPYRVFLY